MMNYKKGIKLGLITALFSGVAVFFNGMVVRAVGDALVFTTIKNLGVGLIVAMVLGAKTRRGEIGWRKIGKKEWMRLVMIGVIGGSLPFYLFFKGLSLAESVEAALIHKSLVLWVAMVAVPGLKEKISLKQIGILMAIFLSNLIIGGFEGIEWGRGELMILGATILWAVENVIAKISLRQVEVEVVVGARMILGSAILLVAGIVSGKMGLIWGLSGRQWGLSLLTVGLLTGYVMSWYRAIKVAPVTLVATVLSLGAVVTNALSAIFITRSLNLGLIAQTILLGWGVGFFVKEWEGRSEERQVLGRV